LFNKNLYKATNDYKLLLSNIKKSINILNIVNITSYSKILNNKTYIQCSIQNISKSNSIEVKDVDIQLTKTNFIRALNPKFSNELIINDSMTLKELKNISINFNKNSDKSNLPILLNPNDKFSIIFQIISNSTNFYKINNDKDKNNNNSNNDKNKNSLLTLNNRDRSNSVSLSPINKNENSLIGKIYF
jgi:hypothetical protein